MQNETSAHMKPVAIDYSSPHGPGKAPRASRTQQCFYSCLWPLGTWWSKPSQGRGHIGNVLAVLPRQPSPSRAGPCRHCWSAALEAQSATTGLSHFCRGDDRQTPSWCPPCRAPGDPSAHRAALGPSSHCCPLQAAQPAPCSSTCLVSLSWAWELTGLDKRHWPGTHMCPIT